MKWKTHIAIAKTIAKRLNLPSSTLIEGIILPDKHRETVNMTYIDVKHNSIYTRQYTQYIPHHKYPNNRLLKHIVNARIAWKKGKINEAMLLMGIAMHYLHDRSVSRYKGLLFKRDIHDDLEEDITDIQVDEEAIEKGIKDSISDPLTIRGIIARQRSYTDAKESMRTACYLSAYMTKAVIAEDNNPIAEKRYYKYKKKSIILIPITLLTILIPTLFYTQITTTFTPIYSSNLHIPIEIAKRAVQQWVAIITGITFISLLIATIDKVRKFILYRRWLR